MFSNLHFNPYSALKSVPYEGDILDMCPTGGIVIPMDLKTQYLKQLGITHSTFVNCVEQTGCRILNVLDFPFGSIGIYLETTVNFDDRVHFFEQSMSFRRILEMLVELQGPLDDECKIVMFYSKEPIRELSKLNGEYIWLKMFNPFSKFVMFDLDQKIASHTVMLGDLPFGGVLPAHEMLFYIKVKNDVYMVNAKHECYKINTQLDFDASFKLTPDIVVVGGKLMHTTNGKDFKDISLKQAINELFDRSDLQTVYLNHSAWNNVF